MAQRDAEHTQPLAISMNSEDLLASRMAGKLLEIKLGEKIEERQTIYRVHPSIRAEDNGAYDPKIISIGPFHRNNKELLPLQQLKWQFLHDQIQRSSSTNSLDNYSKVAMSQKSRARNCYSMDQCTPGSGSDFTSYVSLMDNIIDTSDDVLVLEECGILESKLGGEEKVTKFFNNLRMGAYLEYDEHYLVNLFTKVKEYVADESHQWRAMLVHDYFGNPWSVVSLIVSSCYWFSLQSRPSLPYILRASENSLCAIQKMELPISKVSLLVGGDIICSSGFTVSWQELCIICGLIVMQF